MTTAISREFRHDFGLTKQFSLRVFPFYIQPKRHFHNPAYERDLQKNYQLHRHFGRKPDLEFFLIIAFATHRRKKNFDREQRSRIVIRENDGN